MTKTVLVVDDDPDQLALRVSILKESGLDAVAASSCETALSIVRSRAPCCAVIDLYMPTRDAGIKLITALKQARPGMRLLLLTGRQPGEQDCNLVDEVIIKGRGTAAIVQKVAQFVLKA